MLTLLPVYVALICQTSKTPAWTEQTFSDVVTVSCPAKFKPVDSSKSSQGQADVWRAIGEDAVYSIAVATVPENHDAWQKSLSNFMAGLHKHLPGKIVGERNILVQGWPGIAVTVERPDESTVVNRYLISGNHVVMLGAMYDDDTRPASIDKFLDSLKLTTPGDQKAPVQILSRFPLGDSGITALFPFEPELNKLPLTTAMVPGAKVSAYISAFCFRTFSVIVIKGPDDGKETTEAERSAEDRQLLDAVMAETGSKSPKEREFGIGKEVGLCREYSDTKGYFGQMVAFIRTGNRAVIINCIGPKTYADPATVDAFLRSLQFKD